jgi:hypothetical protein
MPPYVTRSDPEAEWLDKRLAMPELNLPALELLLGGIGAHHQQLTILAELAPDNSGLALRHPSSSARRSSLADQCPSR